MSTTRLLLHHIALTLALASLPASAQQIAFERLELYGGAAAAVRLGPDVLITKGGRYALYRSTDVGRTWQTLSVDAFGGGAVSSIATTDDGRLTFAAGLNGLYRSTDQGATWSRDSGIFTGRSIQDVSMSPSGRLLTVRIDSITTSALWRSLDSGRTWTLAFDRMIRRNAPLLGDATLIAATTYRVDVVIRTTIWLSSDAGTTWSPTLDTIFRNGHPTLLGSGDIALIQHRDGVMTSSNGGRTWGTASPPSTASIEYLHLEYPTIFASLADGSLHSSDDAGQSWRALGNGFEMETVGIHTRIGDTLIGATASEAVRSVDSGRTWTPIKQGIDLLDFRSIASGQRGAIDVTAGRNLFSSTDAGSSWRRTGRSMLPEITDIRVVQPLADGAVMVAGVGGTSFSSPSRDVWTNSVRGLDGSAFERSILSADLGASGDLVIGSMSGVFRFREEDSVWTSLGLQGFAIPSVAIGRDGALYASAIDPGVNGVFRFDPNTFEWSRIEEGLIGIKAADISDLTVGSDSVVYLASQSGFYRMRPGSSRWERIDAILPLSDFRSIAVHRSGAVAASTRGSLIMSQDGTSWTVIDSGLPARIQSIAFDAEGRLLIATDQNGIHRSRDRVAMVETNEAGMPIRLAARVSPNPATATMWLELSSATQQHYHLELFDARGALRLESTAEPVAGRLEVDVSTLASGRYTYRLSSAGESATGAFVVIR